MTERPTPLQTWETMGVLALASLAAGLWFGQPVLVYLALALLFLGVFIKPAALWVAWGWLRLAHVIGLVNAKIILTLIFYLVLTPIAVCYRLIRGDALRIQRQPADSNWHPRNHTYEKADLEKAW